MRKIGLAILGPALIVLSLPLPAVAAPRPSVSIVSPANGAVIHGSTVTVQVAIHNFKLIRPVLKEPPVLPAGEGHLHYILDSLANFVLTRDVSSSTVHTWTNVSPGRHTIIVELSTSQHILYPGTSPAVVSVTVKAPAPSPVPRLTDGPHTGGAADIPYRLPPAVTAGLGIVLLAILFFALTVLLDRRTLVEA